MSDAMRKRGEHWDCVCCQIHPHAPNRTPISSTCTGLVRVLRCAFCGIREVRDRPSAAAALVVSRRESGQSVISDTTIAIPPHCLS
jgi:hypothetical protein